VLLDVSAQYIDKSMNIKAYFAHNMLEFGLNSILVALFMSRNLRNIAIIAHVGQGTTDLMGGHVDAMVADLASTAPLVRQGKLRLLGTSSAKRLLGWENTPALAEKLPGFDMVGWFAVVAPTGTPAAVIERSNRDINAILADKEVADRIATIGPLVDSSMNVEAVGAFLRSESVRWQSIAKEIGVLPE
jgi:tripartite-type tricarboxylate transporter receptor subunit TctC